MEALSLYVPYSSSHSLRVLWERTTRVLLWCGVGLVAGVSFLGAALLAIVLTGIGPA